MIYFCCDERRRDGVSTHATLNGIDFLEVFDDKSLPFERRQRTLFVHFIKPLVINSPPDFLTENNIRIEGGERIANIKVNRVTAGAGSPVDMKVLVVEVSEAGDFSTYTLRLVKDVGDDDPPHGFDPVLSQIDFSFKVTCDSDFDCKPQRACPPELTPQTEIDYLAKDYESFRQLMLDRLSALAPQWTERSPADLGIALVELLSYAGDYLSYQQDAVATESYIGTARRRVSVRRQARLVDYSMHDGRNARAWIHLKVRSDINGLEFKRGHGRKTTKFFTRTLDVPTLIAQDSAPYKKVIELRPQMFELVAGKFCGTGEEQVVKLYAAHNEMKFYAWGARQCCLPKGATHATLRGHFPDLKPGNVLIFVEARGSETGEPADANPANRCAVRLTKVTLADDPLGGRFEDPATNNAVGVTEIEWASGDALPFPLCVSSLSGTSFIEDVTVALGNVALIDHGQTFTDEPEGRPFDPARDATSLVPPVVPAPDPARTKVAPRTADRCEAQDIKLTPQRYNPRLTQAPLTQAAKYDPKNPPASAAETIDLSILESADIPVPAICLTEKDVAGEWEPRRDLLSSSPSSKEFVVEVETDGTAYLRFGDDQLGARPTPGTRLLATYRIGNGAAGNVGADSLAHLVSSDPAFISDLVNPVILAVTNPLAARGGIDAETIERVRQNAPSAFRRQERAVTREDYAEVARRCDAGIQRAAASFRWTGSWRTVFVTVDRFSGGDLSADFKKRLRGCIERFRMAGNDLEVDGPRYVSLEVKMVVCVKRDYFTSQVEAALLELFSNRVLPDGRRGVFHPDNFTFGQTVYLSPLYAAAQTVAGVDSVDITIFQRQGKPGTAAIDSGKLELGRLEIARLDNNPNFPERGLFSLVMRGGR